MYHGGPPRKVFKPSGSREPRLSNPGSQQEFTAAHDVASGAFHQSSPGQAYLPPPPPLDGSHNAAGFPHPGARPIVHFGPRIPPPVPHGWHPVPPMYAAFPQQRGQGRGYYGHKGRGWGRGGGGGPRGRGGRYYQPKRGRESNNPQSSSNIDSYYSMTMFEDPWKDLLPRKDRTLTSPATSGLEDVAQGVNAGDDGEQTIAIAKVTDPDTAEKSDCQVALDGVSSIPSERQSAESTCGGHINDHIPQRTGSPQCEGSVDFSFDSKTEVCDQSLK